MTGFHPTPLDVKMIDKSYVDRLGVKKDSLKNNVVNIVSKQYASNMELTSFVCLQNSTHQTQAVYRCSHIFRPESKLETNYSRRKLQEFKESLEETPAWMKFGTIPKQQFAPLSKRLVLSRNNENLKSGFRVFGIQLLDPQEALRRLQIIFKFERYKRGSSNLRRTKLLDEWNLMSFKKSKLQKNGWKIKMEFWIEKAEVLWFESLSE